MNAHTPTPKWEATVHNQFGRTLGFGIGATREEALAVANARADHELTQANRNWKWRKARVDVARAALAKAGS